jgi:hypothetical protein
MPCESEPHRLNCAPLEVDQQLAIRAAKELVFGIVLVSLEFALHRARAHDGIIYAAQHLVATGVLGTVCHPRNVDSAGRRALSHERAHSKRREWLCHAGAAQNSRRQEKNGAD